MKFFKASWFPITLGVIILIVTLNQVLFTSAAPQPKASLLTQRVLAGDWQPPDINALPDDEEGRLIHYGRELITNTALYLGPKGKVATIANRMNCQNCHVDAGEKPYAGCFSAVASTYPRYRERSGRIESIEFRINDCLMRSLNGKTIDSNGREMKAMVAYLKWIGKDVSKNKKPAGAGLEELPFLDRAADPIKGREIFLAKCTSCHGADGQGLSNHDSSFYLYPPLWGDNSFNISAGLYRITRMASFIKNNMPFGVASFDAPQLSDEEAWDVAAFIIAQPRPEKHFPEDWPNKATKAIDYPYGPYTDQFSEQQHKFGPFPPIVEARKKK